MIAAGTAPIYSEWWHEMGSDMDEIAVRLGKDTHILRAICIVFPTPIGVTPGPNAYESRNGDIQLRLERVGTIWNASVHWMGSWRVTREGRTPQAAFNLCEWELVRIYKELGNVLGVDD